MFGTKVEAIDVQAKTASNMSNCNQYLSTYLSLFTHKLVVILWKNGFVGNVNCVKCKLQHI